MRKILCLLLAVGALQAAEDISGFWKKLDDDGKPQCIFAVYQHDGLYYGKVIGSYDDGKMTDTIYEPSGRADGVAGNPTICGLDLIYGLQDNGAVFAGSIVDPTNGKIYNCELWLQNGYLMVRGKLFVFGKNLPPWHAAGKGDFPKNFKIPKLTALIPNIPQVN